MPSEREAPEHEVDYEEATEEQPREPNTTPTGTQEIPEGIPKGVVPHVLFLSRFRPSTTTEETIKELFGNYGEVRNVVHKTTVAFIEFARPEDAYKAKHALHKASGLDSESLIVDFKKANTGVKNFSSEDMYIEKDLERNERFGGKRDHERKSRFDDDRRDDRGDDRGRDYYNRDHHSRGDPYPSRRDPPSYDDRGGRDDRFFNKPQPVESYHRSQPPAYLPPTSYRPVVDDRRIPPVDDRRAAPGPPVYENEPPLYREPHGRSPYGMPSHGRPLESGYDDRRPPAKRAFDGPAPISDYPPRGAGGVPPPVRGPPPLDRDFYPPRDHHHLPPPSRDLRGDPRDPRDYDSPVIPPTHPLPSRSLAEPRSRAIEQSTYAANANRGRDAYDGVRTIPGAAPGPPPRYDDNRPARDYPQQQQRPNDYPRGGGGFSDRPINDYGRGPPPEDYVNKRQRF